jgi:hypothetical protein
VGVVFHYLDRNLKVRSLLAGMRRVEGSHTGETIAEAVIPVHEAYKYLLGYFIGDNASPDDTAVPAMLAKLRPDIKNPDSRRVRYLGHIINLAAEVFLFGRNADAFEEESRAKKELSKFETVRKLQHKKGPLGNSTIQSI